MDQSLIELKKKFLKEKKILRQAAIIFLMSKLFFTDDVAMEIKLRITGDEWDVFKKFIADIKGKQEYESSLLMTFHLYTENFFHFTLRSKKLALDYTTQDHEDEDNGIDLSHSRAFLQEITEEIIKMQINVTELKQLAQIRDEVLKPFEDLLPEKVSIEDALESFEEIKECINQLCCNSPKKVSRKEIIQSYKEYKNQPTTSSFNLESGTDAESGTESATTSKKKKRKIDKRKLRKSLKATQVDEDSDSERDFKGNLPKKTFQGLGMFGEHSEELENEYK